MYFSILIVVASCVLSLGCGVKGKPQPPLLPEVMGTGQYNYKNATEGVKVNSKKKQIEEQEENDEEQK